MTLIFFEPGMLPVLKDRSAAGRKAAYARWGNRSNYTPPPPTEPGVPLDGSDPTMTAFADTWIGGGERRYGSLDDVRGTIRVLTTDDSWYPKMDMDYRSGSTEDARVVFDSTKHALVSLADADVPAYPLYRGLGFSEFSFRKPDSLLTEGATFKEDLASWTPNAGLAREFSTGERFGGKVTADVQVVMRVTNAPALPIGRHSTSRWTEVRDGADEHVASGVYRVDKVTKVGDSQYQVDVSWQGLSYDPAAVAGTEWTGVPSSSDAPSQIVRKEDDDPWALFAERMGFVAEAVEKADRSAAGRKAAEARWGNRGLGIAREDMPQIPKKNRDKFFAQLDAEGVGYRDETVDPRTLKQTQAGLNPKQTKVLLDAMRGGSFRGDSHTIIAAKDGHILDGHHRWDAARKFAAEGGSADIRITRVDMSIRELLDRAARFNAEEGIESRGMETVSTFNKTVTFTFAPGLRPVLKGSRTEAARYAASVRWRDAKATASAVSVMNAPHRSSWVETFEDRNEAFYRAIRYNDYSGYEMGSSKWARNLGKGIGTLERKLDQFRKRKGWKKETIISNEDARKLREDYERRYRS